MIKLIRPSFKHKNSFFETVKEFQEEGRKTDLDLNVLEENFADYLLQIENEEKGVNLPDGYVPATILWLVDGDCVLGIASIRHKLNENLIQMGGHIGYEVRPSQRRKGYGSKMLELALFEARKIGIEKVLLTCSDDNIGSWKIIEKNGGKLENKIDFHGVIKRRYWIENK